eukprot:m.91007 g.91007  ORF g.91007 m.91007 type:complete len:548 (-) comp20154_c0_seq1:1062-2705(-)
MDALAKLMQGGHRLAKMGKIKSGTAVGSAQKRKRGIPHVQTLPTDLDRCSAPPPPLLSTKVVHCPSCERPVPSANINAHLDQCLGGPSRNESNVPPSLTTTTTPTTPTTPAAMRTDPLPERETCVAPRLLAAVPMAPEPGAPPSAAEAPPAAPPPGAVAVVRHDTEVDAASPHPLPPGTPGSADSGTQAKKRRTGTVHDFFGGRDTSTPSHFVLDCRNAPSARFERFAPIKGAGLHRLPRTFKWCGKEVSLYCTVQLDVVGGPDQLASPDGSYGPQCIPLLKSHLQKCVRRSLGDLAVQTAAHLLRLAPVDLLRRLAIIMVEDVAVHRSLPTLMWLTAAASKGCVLTAAMQAWVLGVVQLLALSPVRELTPRLDIAAAKVLKAVSTTLGDGADADVLYALLLRRSFGGMGGDMKQLVTAAERWLPRLAVTAADPHGRELLGSMADVVPVPVGSVPGLKLSQWELSAVDFHCSDTAKRLAQRCGIDEDRVKSAMWHCSSSVTNKKVHGISAPVHTQPGDDATDLATVWGVCQESFQVFARQAVQRKME